MRRQRLIGPLLVLALAAAWFVMLARQGSPAGAQQATDPNTFTPGQVVAGRQLYLVHCSSCHGLDAQGIGRSPTLVGAGAASADFYLRTGRMPLNNPADQPMRHRPAFSATADPFPRRLRGIARPGPADTDAQGGQPGGRQPAVHPELRPVPQRRGCREVPSVTVRSCPACAWPRRSTWAKRCGSARTRCPCSVPRPCRSRASGMWPATCSICTIPRPGRPQPGPPGSDSRRLRRLGVGLAVLLVAARLIGTRA